MDFITVHNGSVIIPKNHLVLSYLMENGGSTIPIIGNTDTNGYSIEIKIIKNEALVSIYDSLILANSDLPVLLNSKKMISYGECILYDQNIILSLVWIYSYYFKKTVTIFLPEKIIKYFEEFVDTFNKELIKDDKYFLTDLIILPIIMEALENCEFGNNSNNVIIFGYFELINNTKRFNTQLKRIMKRGTVHILSSTSLNLLDVPCLSEFDSYQYLLTPLINIKSIFDNYSLIDLLDPDEEEYSINEDSLVELIISLVSENKTIYLSLNLDISKLKSIENKLNGNNISTSRKENENSRIVINSSKTSGNTYLKNNYDVYVLIFPLIIEPLDILNYLKCIGDKECEIFFDSRNIKNIESNISAIITSNNSTRPKKMLVLDSGLYKSYNECKDNCKSLEPILATDTYYYLESPESFEKMNLSNLERKDYDVIRNYVKCKLNSKYGLDNIKTCQLSTPCSPKDRSKKLNSLSNKLSCFDYRCDITCEIFKDFSIGVIVWSDIFANRKKIDTELLKNQTYIYQTTCGKWKYSIIN